MRHFQEPDEAPKNILILTFTRPIGNPLTRPLRRKLRISADSPLIWQKIGTFLYKMMRLKVG